MDTSSLRELVRDIPDWPQPGIVFRDITPLLAAPDAFTLAVDELAAPYADEPIDKVLGVEARGFVFAAPLAYRRGAGFVPVRKAGKLPWDIEREEYAVHPGERVLIVDDVIATGGTAAATARLVQRLGGTVVGLTFLLELVALGGRMQLEGRRVDAVLRYE